MDKKELIAQITCRCCSSFFHEPRLLPCLHTLCLDCVTRCSSRTTSTTTPTGVLPTFSVTCPVCHSQATVPPGGFAVDVWKSSQLDTLAPIIAGCGPQSPPPGTTATPPPECAECRAHDAPWWCASCSMFLCNDDMAHHSRAWRTASHKTDAVSPMSYKPALCYKHPQEELLFYCNTDHSLICRDCTLDDHKNHDFVVSIDLSSKFKENIGSLCSMLVSHLEKVSLSKLTAIGCCKNAEEVQEKVESEIRTEFAKIVAVVNAREAQLLSDLKAITDSAKKTFQENIEGCDNKMKVVQEAQEYTQLVTTKFTDLQLVAVNDTLSSRVKKLCTDVPTPNNLKVRFDCESAAICGKISSSLGRLVHNSAAAGTLITAKSTLMMKTLKRLDTSMVPSVTPRMAQRLFVDNATGKVYWDGGFNRPQLTEFANMASFVNNTNPRQFTLKDVPAFPEGPYQAVHNGHVYCTPLFTPTMTKVRVSDGSTVATAPLPNAGHSSSSAWDKCCYSDNCWYVDAGGVLYVVHAPPDNGNIHITRVDPDNLAILQTWVVPRVKKTTGFAFVVCGNFYFGKASNSREIDGVFDTTTGVYDDTYRNSLPTSGTFILLISWIPSTNQLLVVDCHPENFDNCYVFLFDDVAL
ncbi:E3 ubiquitin-protein ligase TRIM71 [Pelomyxa schiedti]|nr:E3 ubiquitin-protein ligase TRIM71 [Pelomyxa schiedti]